MRLNVPWYAPGWRSYLPPAVGAAALILTGVSAVLIYRNPKAPGLLVPILLGWTYLPLVWFFVEKHWLFRGGTTSDAANEFRDAQRSAMTLWVACSAFLFGMWTLSIVQPVGQSVEPTSVPAGDDTTLIQLFQTQLSFLTVLLTVIGGVFVIFQVMLQFFAYRREKALEQRESGLIISMKNMVDIATSGQQSMHMREAGLIESMKNMVEIATTGQKPATELISSMKNMVDMTTTSQSLVEKLKQEVQTLKDEFTRTNQRTMDDEERQRAAMSELKSFLVDFLAQNSRFQMSLKHLKNAHNRISESIQNSSISLRDEMLPGEAWIVQGYNHALIDSDAERAANAFSRVIDKRSNEPQLVQVALFNRGIDYTDLQQYESAARDFDQLMQDSRSNLTYRYWRIETERQEAGQANYPAQAMKRIINAFEELTQELKQNDVESKPMGPDLLASRTARSYGSILFISRKFDEAATTLSVSVLDNDAPSLYLRLRVKNAQEPVRKLEESDVSACLKKANEDFKTADQLRTRIQRGMITAECYRWLGQNEAFQNRIGELIALTSKLKRVEGGRASVFSPLTQRNERIDTIEEQIKNMRIELE